MGFIKTIADSVSGTFADGNQDFFIPKQGVSATAAVFPGVLQTRNNDRGQNNASENVITNGSRIVVPEGTALITVENGKITGFITEPGKFEFRTDDPNSKSFFAGDGLFGQTIKQTWDRIKFGGIPATQQQIFYVNLKLITGNRFGTQTPIYWQDEYLATRAGGSARGTYSLKIVDPLLFVKNFVPVEYLQPNAPVFDFADMDNPAGDHLFNDFLTCLTGAFKRFSLKSKENGMDTIDFIQSNLDKFALTMDEEIENTYQWSTNYGLKVVSVNLQAEYDGATLEVLEEARKADQEIRKATRMGQAYSNNMTGMMAAASGQAMQAAAANSNGALAGFMGMGMAQQNGVNLMGSVNNMQQQSSQQVQEQPTQSAQTSFQDPTTKLLEMKKLLDAGAISQEEYDKVKAQVLGL